MLKIGFITSKDAKDKGVWSGIVYQMYKALERNGAEVMLLGPVKPIEKLFIKWYAKYLKVFYGRKIDVAHTVALSKAYARVFDSRILKHKLDVVFSPAGSTEIAHLNTSLPIVYTTDATFSLLNGYYQNFSKHDQISNDEANLIEKKALEKASIIVYPSDWAQNSAICDYNINPKKIFVHPYGANIEPIFPNPEVKSITTNQPIYLLFLGVDWERKGGKIAYQAFLKLYEKYSNVYLIICGCVAPIPPHSNIETIGFLDKNKDAEKKIFDNLLKKSHFLILPTFKECYGIVFCEASAYGIPSFAYNTGGVAGAVKEGVNGHLLPMKDGGHAYADKIEYYLRNPDKYSILSESAIKHYNNNCNWDAWAQNIIRLIKTLH